MNQMSRVLVLLLMALLVFWMPQTFGDWAQFQNSHVLNPEEYPNFWRWSQSGWEAWLLQREEIDEKMRADRFKRSISRSRGTTRSRRRSRSRPPRKLTEKPINSAIVGTIDEILSSFNPPGVQYNLNDTIYWSETPFDIYNFRENPLTGLREVLSCPQMYFVAKIQPGDDPDDDGTEYPIHFETFGRVRVTLNSEMALKQPWHLCNTLLKRTHDGQDIFEPHPKTPRLSKVSTNSPDGPKESKSLNKSLISRIGDFLRRLFTSKPS